MSGLSALLVRCACVVSLLASPLASAQGGPAPLLDGFGGHHFTIESGRSSSAIPRFDGAVTEADVLSSQWPAHPPIR